MSFASRLEKLQAFLDADDLHEEALDYMAGHGFLTALAIAPTVVPEREWLDALFAEPPVWANDEQRQLIEDTLCELHSRIASELASDEEFELPCDLDLGDEPDYSDLRSWCVGFMEGVFMREDDWFAEQEETVSELLLPVMVGSGLFDDQPEFVEINREAEVVDEMLEHIPDTLTQLFLLFHAPEDKGKPALLQRH